MKFIIAAVDDERRTARRYEILFPMRIEGADEQPGLAVSRNISTGGLLMATATDLEPGGIVKIAFRVGEDDPREHHGEGHIVRVGSNEEDPQGLWPYMVAVQWEPPLDELIPVLERLGADEQDHG